MIRDMNEKNNAEDKIKNEYNEASTFEGATVHPHEQFY